MHIDVRYGYDMQDALISYIYKAALPSQRVPLATDTAAIAIETITSAEAPAAYICRRCSRYIYTGHLHISTARATGAAGGAAVAAGRWLSSVPGG
jgi:hypothetical protein